MSPEQNMDILIRLIEEGFNRGNLDALDTCFPSTYIDHQFDLPSSREEFKASVRYLRDTFAPFSLTIEDMVSDGDTVWARMIGRGTHSREFMGCPPMGKSFTISVIDVCRFEDGKIVEH